MASQVISFEYCHVTPDTNWEQEITLANTYAPKVLRLYPNAKIQKCIMIDDLQSKAALDKEQLRDIIKHLLVKPDVIYLESSFVFSAVKLLAKIDSRVAFLKKDKEEIWLKSIKDKYGSLHEFLLSWKKGDGQIKFSCPTLVASSYLSRAGANNADIEIVFGNKIEKADKILNLLSSRYLQVEVNAQLLLKASSKEVVNNIQWVFV